MTAIQSYADATRWQSRVTFLSDDDGVAEYSETCGQNPSTRGCRTANAEALRERFEAER